MQKVLFLLALSLLSSVVEAQPLTPTIIQGCVEEEDGDPVVGIKVTAENYDDGYGRSDDTNEEGCYQVQTGREFQLAEGEEVRVFLTYGGVDYEEFEQVGSYPIIIVDFVVEESPSYLLVWAAISILGVALTGIFLYLKYHPLDNNDS